MENLAAAATDGVHLYATVFDNGRAELAAIALPDGDTSVVDVPDEVASPAVSDISPDGSRLLLRDHLSPESEQPLWLTPTLGGSALRVGNTLAHDATWMPDGKTILYANGNRLLLTGVNSAAPEVYANLPGRALWLRWSPDGKLLRFTVADPLAHTVSLWQISPDDRNPKRILSGFHEPSSECCGVWTSDGRWFVFQSSRGGNTDLWRLAGKATDGAERVTDGPLQFQAPVAAKEGDRVYFIGADARSELDHLGDGGELVPERGFLAAAMRVDYSRDGRSVAWTDSCWPPVVCAVERRRKAAVDAGRAGRVHGPMVAGWEPPGADGPAAGQGVEPVHDCSGWERSAAASERSAQCGRSVLVAGWEDAGVRTDERPDGGRAGTVAGVPGFAQRGGSRAGRLRGAVQPAVVA